MVLSPARASRPLDPGINHVLVAANYVKLPELHSVGKGSMYIGMTSNVRVGQP